MVPAVSSTSVALKVLQVQALEQAAPGSAALDPLKQALDPRSLVVLPAQSFDALLKVRAQLRTSSVQAPQTHQGLPTLANTGTAQSSMLAATETEDVQMESALDFWRRRIEPLRAHAGVPDDSPLMPWNSADVIQQLKDDDVHVSNHRARARQIRASDALVRQSMAETPPEDTAQIRARGGTVWYEYNQTFDRLSDQEFARNIKNYALYGFGLDEPIDPSNERSQAFLKGTAQIIRASKTPEVQYKDVNYDMYTFSLGVNHYTQVGQWGHYSYNELYEYELEKKNPTMNVSAIWAEGDIAFILYPKTGAAASASTAVAQGSAAATGAKPVAAAAS